MSVPYEGRAYLTGGEVYQFFVTENVVLIHLLEPITLTIIKIYTIIWCVTMTSSLEKEN